MTFDNDANKQLEKSKPTPVDVLGLPMAPAKQRQVDRARRPVRRQYVTLAIVFLAVLGGIVVWTVWQRAPVVTSYVMGWVLNDGRTGYAFRVLASDSPLQPPSDPDQIGFERHLFALINKARQDRGLPLLRYNDNLARAAHAHALEMARLQRFDVTDIGSQSLAARLQSVGYPQPEVALELIGGGFQRPDQVILAMMAHPDAEHNLLSPDVSEVGTGYAFTPSDPAYRHYWVINFARRAVNYTLVVNDGADSTTSPEITLRIGGKGWARQMQVSTLPDFSDAAWEAYAETKTITLSSDPGLRKIYVKLRGVGGEEVTIIGEITLNSP